MRLIGRAVLIAAAVLIWPACLAARCEDVLVLRVPLFYQAKHIKDLLETYQGEARGVISRQATPEERAVSDERRSIQSFIAPNGRTRTAPFSIRVITDQGLEKPKEAEKPKKVRSSSSTAPDEKQSLPAPGGPGQPLSTGRAELIGSASVLSKALQVIDQLDRPDPILDVDVMVFRIAGNDDKATREYEKLLLQVAEAQRIGESLNLVAPFPGLADDIVPSVRSFVTQHEDDHLPIVRESSTARFRVRSWDELRTIEDFQRRLELRTLLIALAETKALRDGQAKGQIMRRILMQRPFTPSELVSAVSLAPAAQQAASGASSSGAEPLLVPGNWITCRVDISRDALGRGLPGDKKAIATLEFRSLDDYNIAAILGIDLRYDDHLDSLRERLSGASGDVRKARVVAISDPAEIDRLLQLTMLQPSLGGTAAGAADRQSVLFDRNTLRLSSEVTLQLRSGYRQDVSVGTVTSELHHFSAEDMQRLGEAVAGSAKAGTGSATNPLKDVAGVLRNAKRVVVTEDLTASVLAFAVDLTSAHYYPNASYAKATPALPQSSFGSIGLSLNSQIQLLGEMRESVGVTAPATATAPIGGIKYETVIDSTSYRPNLVLAMDFRRELTSKPAPLPSLLGVAGSAWATRSAHLNVWETGLLVAAVAEVFKGQRSTTTQAMALVLTPRPRTALPCDEILDEALRVMSEPEAQPPPAGSTPAPGG